MKPQTTLALIIVVGLVVTSVHADDESSQKSQLQGVWVFSKGETNGKPLGDLLLSKGLHDLKIEFSGDLMTMHGFGAADHKYQFTLNPKGQPQAIELQRQPVQYA